MDYISKKWNGGQGFKALVAFQNISAREVGRKRRHHAEEYHENKPVEHQKADEDYVRLAPWLTFVKH